MSVKLGAQITAITDTAVEMHRLAAQHATERSFGWASDLTKMANRMTADACALLDSSKEVVQNSPSQPPASSRNDTKRETQ